MISLALLSGSSANATDVQKGISQYNWGDSASSYKGLSKLGDKGDVSYYSRPEEMYMIGGVSVDKIIYGFYKDQLFGVYINIDSIDMYDKLRSHMNSQYGLPVYKTTADNRNVYKWKQENIAIKLKTNTTDRKMKLVFYYRPLSSKLNAKQWEELDTTSFHFVPIEKDKKPEKFVLFKF